MEESFKGSRRGAIQMSEYKVEVGKYQHTQGVL